MNIKIEDIVVNKIIDEIIFPYVGDSNSLIIDIANSVFPEVCQGDPFTYTPASATLPVMYKVIAINDKDFKTLMITAKSNLVLTLIIC